MRKAIILVISLIILTFFIIVNDIPVFSNSDQLTKPQLKNHQHETVNPFDILYHYENVIFSELKISAWAKIKNISSSREQLENIINLVQKEFEINEEVSWQQKDTTLLAEVGSLSNGYRISVSAVTLSPLEQGTGTYLSVNLDGLKHEEQKTFDKKISRIFEYFNVKPNISKTMISFIPEELTITEQEEIVHTMMHSINGIITEGVTKDNLVSYTGYTPYFKNNAESLGKKININIAARYHNLDGKTYLYMGTPVIHCQY